MAEPLDAVGEIGVAVFAAMIDEGDLVGAAGGEIALQDVGGEIVVARHRGRDWQLALWRFARLNQIHRTCILGRFPAQAIAAHMAATAWTIMPMVQPAAMRY